jgi:lysophospholipase L1-like esterase
VLVTLAGALTGALMVAGCGDLVSTHDGDAGPGVARDADIGASAAAADPGAVESVVMIGDSITKGSLGPLERRFVELGFDPVIIEAENGKRLAQSLDVNPSGAAIARFLAGADQDHADEVWVVALGTNDVGNYARPDEIAAAVNEVLAAVPDESPLVWVDVHLPRRPEATAEFNAIVRERLVRRGNSTIAPWSQAGQGDGVLSGDAVHPTTAGTEVFAAVVADTVRSFLGR